MDVAEHHDRPAAGTVGATRSFDLPETCDGAVEGAGKSHEVIVATKARTKGLSLLGPGGMGEAHRALGTNLKREVAVKVLPASLAGDPERLARLSARRRTPRLAQSPEHDAPVRLRELDCTLAEVIEWLEERCSPHQARLTFIAT